MSGPAAGLPAEELPRLQEMLLEMLVELDRICRAHGIRYTLYGGTMIGAVRHKGFIPWDDDADVAMLRGDYEKFRAVCRDELDDSLFYFQDDRATPGYRWGYGKLRRRGTDFTRAGQEHMPYPQGIFLDIFPQDSVPPKWGGLFDKLCYIVRKLQWSEVGRVSEKSAFLRGWYRVLSRIPFSLVQRFYYGLVRWGQRHPASAFTRVLSWPRTRGRKTDIRREMFTDVADYEFEGHLLMGMRDYDGFLTFIFRDYMRLPPEGSRCATHAVSSYSFLGPASPPAGPDRL